MQEKIQDICEKLCGKDIGLDEQLIISGQLDSFNFMKLICSLEEEFHITFLPEEISDLDNFSCVNSIVGIVGRKTAFDINSQGREIK